MLGECAVHKFSQLVYLELPGELRAGASTVGELADYYTGHAVGRAYVKARFGSIAQEYDLWKRFLAESLDDVRGFRITEVLDDNGPDGTGLYACVYRSPAGETVAAFRGSEMLGNRRYRNDYETDFALSYEKQTPQQSRVERFLHDSPAFRRSFILTGHSLGGNLALYAAVRAPDQTRMDACYAFNAPGFNSGMIAGNRARIEQVRGRLYPLQNEHDIVSSLLLDLCEPVVVESLYHPAQLPDPGVGEILYPHSNFQYREEDGRFARAPGNQKDALCGRVHRLTKLFLRLPDAVKKAVCGTVLEVIYTAQPPGKQLEFLLERVTKHLVRQGIDESQLELGAGLFWARQTAGEETASQLYRKLQGGRLDAREEIAEAAVLLFQLLRYGCAGPDCERRAAAKNAS